MYIRPWILWQGTRDLIETIMSWCAMHTILYLVQPSGSQNLAIELSSSVLECSSSRLAPHVASSNQHLSQVLDVEQVSICYQVQVLIVVVQRSAASYTNMLSWSSISNPFSVQLKLDKPEERAWLRSSQVLCPDLTRNWIDGCTNKLTRK